LLIGMIGTLWVALRRAGRRLTHGPPRGVAVAAAAIGLALIFQFFSESLLTQPAILWYAVAPMAWAISAGRSHVAHARLPGASVPSAA
jgi:hypothetical protein